MTARRGRGDRCFRASRTRKLDTTLGQLLRSAKKRAVVKKACCTPSLADAPARLRREQLAYRYFQSQRDALNVVERDVPLVTLDMRDESAINVGFKCQSLLSPPLLRAETNHVEGEQLARRRDFFNRTGTWLGHT